MKIEREIVITPTSVVLDGQAVETQETGAKMLVELYRRFAGDYPKFFKMDTLSRLGFIAAELLLSGRQTDNPSRQQHAVDGIILANRSASIKNDRDYLATIAEDRYYPSPALFVYTLPNIVTGEIAIRHRIQGETSFYILDRPEELEPLIGQALSRSSAAVLAGWCECTEENEFYAKLQIIWNN